MDQALNSQKTPHTSPLRASYGMSFVSILMKNDRVIKGFYCTIDTKLLQRISIRCGRFRVTDNLLRSCSLTAMLLKLFLFRQWVISWTILFLTWPACNWSLAEPHLQPWWRHQMETFSALLALCEGNSPITGEFPSHRPVTRSFDVFFDLCLIKRLSKQLLRRWFATPPRSL